VREAWTGGPGSIPAMQRPADHPRYRVESLDNALRLLLLLQQQPELRVTSAAQRLGIAPSTVHRLLTTLAARHFVTQDRVTRAYRVGPALIELGVGSVGSYDLRAASLEHLHELGKRTGEAVNVLVLQGTSTRFIAGYDRRRRQPSSGVLTGTLLPAYATSGGKALLAELPRDTLREMYPGGLRKLTPHTKTFTQLLEELSLVIMTGYAINHGESEVGLSAIAVPLRDQLGRTIAAVAISAPTDRIPASRVRELVIGLRECAAYIRADLRAHPSAAEAAEG